jgi:chromosome segregation ATPase
MAEHDADAATPKVATLDDVLAEYESYRLKTKEWQAKVRDRDAKMRQQLLASTQQLQEKEKEVGELHRQARLRESALQSCAQLTEELNSLRTEISLQAREIAELKVAKDQAVVAHRAAEEELQEKHRELKRARHRVEEAEQWAKEATMKSQGLHILHDNGVDPPPAEGIKVLRRVAIDGVGYCFCSNSRGEKGWVEEQQVMQISGIDIPASDDELHRKQVESAVTEAHRTCHALLEKELAALDAKHRLTHHELEQKFDKERSAWDLVRNELERRLQESTAEHTARLEVVERQLKCREEATAAAVCNAVSAESERNKEVIERLQAQVQELEEYKTRAQIAMKNAKASQKPDDQEKVAELRRQWEGDHARDVQGLQKELDHALRQCDGAVLEALRLKSELRDAHAAFAHERAEFHAQIQELRNSMNAHKNETNLQSVSPAVVPAKVLFSQESQTEAPQLPLNVNNCSDQFEAKKSDEDLSKAQRIADHHDGSGGFDLSELMSTLGNKSTDSLRDRDIIVAKLRDEISAQHHVITELREELRELAAAENRHVVLESALKEELRAAERTIKRSQEMARADYVKNVVLQALLCKDNNIKKSLVPVLTEVLQLSHDERLKILAMC